MTRVAQSLPSWHSTHAAGRWRHPVAPILTGRTLVEAGGFDRCDRLDHLPQRRFLRGRGSRRRSYVKVIIFIHLLVTKKAFYEEI